MADEKEQEEFWENVYSTMEEEFKKFNADFERNFIKPNIVLSGKTGVGKSTLINAVFGCDLAKEGTGKPVSQSLIEYNVSGIPVNLFDTRGMELDPLGREQSRKSIIDEIKNRANSSEVGDHMHVMWYCISNESRRIEDTELEWIKDFSQYFPVIVVLTQTIDDDESLKKVIQEECPGILVCNVLSKERTLYNGAVTIPSHGLKKLIEETINILPEATKRAFTAAQKIKIEEKIDSAKKLLQERLDSKRPLNYKNLAHFADTLPIGLDVLGKGAVYLYIAKDIMTVMGIPVSKNFLKFSKQARPLLKSILLPFVIGEGTKTAGKAALKFGGEKIGKETIAFISKLLGKTLGKTNILLSPAVGFIFGTYNRKVTELIANGFIEVCSEFLRSNIDYQDLSNEEVINILSKNMQEKMKDIQGNIEESLEEDTVTQN